MGYELCEFRFYEGTHGTVVSKSAIYQVLEDRDRSFFRILSYLSVSLTIF
jgi:hypothetical protein